MCIFRKPSLIRPSFLDGFVYARLFKGFFPPNVDRARYLESSSPAKVIAHLEPVLTSQPANWHVRYIIGDWYMRDLRYVDSLRSLLEAYRLRPKDVRSTYAVATAYRVLARASLEGMDIQDALKPQFERLRSTDPRLHRLLMMGLSEFDPATSADELERIELTIDEVAARALEFFEETIALRPRAEERKMVDSSLQEMYSEFPHLEVKVKSSRRTNTGVFGPARKGAGGLWNEARDHYARLRYLMNDRPRYRYELGEVIRLCQWCIAADKKDGDAHVLLANAYSLLDGSLSYDIGEPHKYMFWAASILQHWAETPLCQYPFTKNVEIGQTLYTGVLQQLTRLERATPDQIIDRIQLRKESDLQKALSPATFETIREQLKAEPI